MATRAELLFQQIMNAPDPAAFLHAMILPTPRVESEILDYKCGGKLKDQDIQRIWAKILSGFGNTGGGVVVWGIDARPTKLPDPSGRERMLDVPKAADLHPDPPALVQRLRDLLRDATEHPVLGVRIEPIIDPSANGAGFVLCFVPSGNEKPYQSAVDSIFYMRVQDGFNPLPYTMLRSLFYPRTRPRLQISAKVHFGNIKIPGLNLEIRNAGTATARQMVADIQSDQKMWMISGDGQLFSSSLMYPSEGGITRQRLTAFQDLHPEEQRHMGNISWNLAKFPDAKPPQITIAIYMADHPPSHFLLSVRAAELIQNNALIVQQEESPD